ALCDSLAAAGGMEQMPLVFQQPDPRAALAAYIRLFARFWEADRPVTRRLRALAQLDPDVGQVIRARDERRRQGVRVLLDRWALPALGALAVTALLVALAVTRPVGARELATPSTPAAPPTATPATLVSLDWLPRASMSGARYGLTAALGDNGRIYAIGGDNA